MPVRTLFRAANYVLRRDSKAPSPPSPAPKEEEMSKLDAYINYGCKLVSWEDTTLTWISFICVNLLYSLLIYYETRFYCLVFSTAALVVVLDYYDEVIKFNNLTRYIYVRDITTWCSTFMYHMHCWKRDNPSLFCGVMTTFFLTLSFIGRTISGRILAYFFILGVYFGPALLKHAPKEVQNSFWQFITTLRSNEIVNENDLIPVITENSDDDNNEEIRTQDSFTTSLISGIFSMPSHIDEYDPADLQEDDLLPADRTKHRRRGDLTDPSSDSELDHTDGMHFDTKHFIGDSSTSSSDDERYAKDLQFSDSLQDASVLGTYAGGVFSNLLSNLQANFSSQATQPERVASTRRDSSDQSDFEIINTDDAET